MGKLSIYLAGPITGLSDEDKGNWRERFKSEWGEKYEYEVRNPLDRDYKYKDMNDEQRFSAIANDERADILNCDVTIAYLDKVSMGTAMGIMYAYLSGRTVVIVTAIPFDELSPMVRYHAHEISTNFDDAITFIEKRHSRCSISEIKKRDGRKVKWDPQRINSAIKAAIDEVYTDELDESIFPKPRAEKLANAVIMQIEDDLELGRLSRDYINVETVQDKIEKILIDNAHRGEVRSLAKAYIVFRRNRQNFREAQGNDNEKMKFMNDILHDMKGPGGNIGRYIEFLEDALSNENLDDAAEIIRDLRKNQATLMKNILNSRLKAEKRFMKVREKLHPFAQKVFNNYKNQDITFHNEIPGDIHVEASPEKLQIIFQNLIDNSIKHGFKGKGGNIHIDANKTDHGNFLLKYWNDGDEISDKDAEAMFSGVRDGTPDSESFHHGMSQVRRFVEELGGTIECRPNRIRDKQPGRSNIIKYGVPVFRIKLPLCDAENSGRKIIMIADDNEGDRRMMNRIIDRGGYEVVEAASINEALHVIKKGQIYGAVLDVDFGEARDGIWLLKQIKNATNGVKVIVVTGSTGEFNGDWRMEAERLGALKVFDKADYKEDQILGVFNL